VIPAQTGELHVSATIRPRRRGVATPARPALRAIASLLIAFAAAGCASGTDGDGDSAQPPAPAVTPPPVVPPSSAPATAAPPADPATCFHGSYDVVSITAQQGVATAVGMARPAGAGGSLVFDLRPDGTWRLSSDGSRPVAFQVGPYTVDARIAGTLSGTYRRTGTTFEFEQDDANGTVTLSAPAGEQEYDMDVVGPALAPGGAATITCHQNTVDFVSATVTMTLRRRA
jgi:hypothetical protein